MEDKSETIVALAKHVLEADPNKQMPIEMRVAAFEVAIAALRAETARQTHIAIVAKAMR